MSLTAHFQSAETNRAARRTLLLEADGVTAQGPASVTIHNVSLTGMLLETAVRLNEGEAIDVDLPEAGPRTTTVVWSDGMFHGCKFNAPISPAALSAIELRSEAPPAPAPAPAPAAQRADTETFAARLRRLRSERGMTLAAIGEALGVSKPTVWAWEQGRAQPIAPHMAALAALFGQDEADLAGNGSSAELQDALAKARLLVADLLKVNPAKVRILLEL